MFISLFLRVLTRCVQVNASHLRRMLMLYTHIQSLKHPNKRRNACRCIQKILSDESHCRVSGHVYEKSETYIIFLETDINVTSGKLKTADKHLSSF